MSLDDDIEDCEDFQTDPYAGLTTTSARAKLCGQCVHYTMQHIHMTSIRCKLELRPKAEFNQEKKIWTANCIKFENIIPHTHH
ncbi:MAG: hypothetical protein SFU25_10520 [Candidatus Caenarcaniphilales bacterium]|nr:hypothetical protein [Candidatus Caenarcaniphilales bacterium]